MTSKYRPCPRCKMPTVNSAPKLCRICDFHIAPYLLDEVTDLYKELDRLRELIDTWQMQSSDILH